MTTTPAEREAFEAWQRSRGMDARYIDRNGDGYLDTDADADWVVWQARAASQHTTTPVDERPKTWDEIAKRAKALGFHYPSGGENLGTLVIDLMLAVEQARAASQPAQEIADFVAKQKPVPPDKSKQLYLTLPGN